MHLEIGVRTPGRSKKKFFKCLSPGRGPETEHLNPELPRQFAMESPNEKVEVENFSVSYVESAKKGNLPFFNFVPFQVFFFNMSTDLIKSNIFIDFWKCLLRPFLTFFGFRALF